MSTFYSDEFVQYEKQFDFHANPVTPLKGSIQGGHESPLRLRSRRVDLRQATLAANDVIRMWRVKSHQRIHRMILSADDRWAATVLITQVGVALVSDTDYDSSSPLVIDTDTFGAFNVVNAGEARKHNEMLVSNTPVVEREHLGMPIWTYIANVGSPPRDPEDGLYAEDPRIAFDIILTVAVATSITTTGYINGQILISD